MLFKKRKENIALIFSCGKEQVCTLVWRKLCILKISKTNIELSVGTALSEWSVHISHGSLITVVVVIKGRIPKCFKISLNIFPASQLKQIDGVTSSVVFSPLCREARHVNVPIPSCWRWQSTLSFSVGSTIFRSYSVYNIKASVVLRITTSICQLCCMRTGAAT